MDKNLQQPAAPDAAESTEAKARREFIKRIGKTSAAAPAVALLMAASFKDAKAQVPSGGSGSS
jgi:hypothetical protein